MSEKKIIVSNVAKEYSNPIAELVQVACQFDSEIRLESNEARKVLWGSWHLIRQRE